MPPRWSIVVAFVVLAGFAGIAQAQAEPVDVSVDAVADGEPLDVVFPGQAISVFANVTVPEDEAYRAFLNVSLDEEPVAGDMEEAQEGLIEVDTWFAAPEDEGEHTLGWTVTVQSQEEDGAWVTEQEEQGTVTFTVEERAPPSPEEVMVDVDILGGDEAGVFTPGEQVLVRANVTTPERAQTAWQGTVSILQDGDVIAEAQHQRSGEGLIELPVQFRAPVEEDEHAFAWSVVVEYQDTNVEASPWEGVLEEEEAFTLTVESPVAPPAPFPWVWVLLVGALLAGGAGAAYWWTQRDRQIRGHARSQAMQDLEGESFEQPAAREPEVHPQVKILEAREEDLRRMIELARERHEAGDLTEHQYKTIRERKEAELEEVQAEMDEYR